MRTLTGTEYNDFFNDHPLLNYGQVPQWGDIVEWNGKQILVYFAPVTHRAFLTDVSDAKYLFAQYQVEYNPINQMWWYHLPGEIIVRVGEVAQAAGAVISDVVKPSFTIPMMVITLAIVYAMSMRRS